MQKQIFCFPCLSNSLRKMILGIDFGAKLAGTTVIARMYDHNKVDFAACQKQKDADQFILDYIKEQEDVWLVYIDAPLSLPSVYKDENVGNDYFYREADRATKAMSPLFLGGLTARAMRLSSELKKAGVKVVETYPAKLAEVLKLKELDYKQKNGSINENCDQLKVLSSFEFNNDEVLNWHYFDALLALYSAKRYEMQAAMVFGDYAEGTITV